MSTQGPDFMRDYQGFAQQAWDTWIRNWQVPHGAGATPPFFGQPSAQPTIDETLSRSLAGFRSYLEWLQSAAGSGLGQGGADWMQPLQRLFGSMQPSFAQAFGGIDSASVQGFGQQWQQWLQAAQPTGFLDPRGISALPAFGYTREQQEKQQALQQAIVDHLEASKRYHELMLRAQMQGVERLQQKLAGYTDSNQQVESLKALYDLWIDSAEEAYAEIALSDEFREVYGAQVNTQMRVRQLQKEQLEQVCRQLGMPTASEVESLGKRLQELRRELREVKQQAATRPAPASGEEKPAEPRRKSSTKTASRAARSTATSKSAVRATPRKRS